MNIRKTLRWLHRDIGYLVVGITFIYTVSGIAMNHRQDWNPHYSLISEEASFPESQQLQFSQDEIKTLLNAFIYQPVYKKHFVTKDGIIKIFVNEGTVLYRPKTGKAELEVLKKRAFFYPLNKIHLAQTDRIWIWISDAMSVCLLFVAISGLFILKGKYGLTGRGLWLTSIGVIVPLVAILFFIN